MPTVILRLLPTNPVTGDAFTAYLDGLTIEAHELSLVDPTGQGAAIGSASYLAPNLPPSPSADPLPQPDANTRINQHFSRRSFSSAELFELRADPFQDA